jgi:hypothetical protein
MIKKKENLSRQGLSTGGPCTKDFHNNKPSSFFLHPFPVQALRPIQEKSSRRSFFLCRRIQQQALLQNTCKKRVTQLQSSIHHFYAMA